MLNCKHCGCHIVHATTCPHYRWGGADNSVNDCRRMDTVALLKWLDDNIDARRVERICDWLQRAGYPTVFEDGSALLIRGWVLNNAMEHVGVSIRVPNERLFVIGVDPLDVVPEVRRAGEVAN